MNTALKMLLLMGRGNNGAPAGQTWASYVTGLNPLAWYRHMQTSGTNEPNQGSLGSAVNMTITSTTLGQTGKLGPNNAYLTDGALSRLQTANNATLAALTSFEYVFLINPTTAGELSFGRFACWGNGSSGQGYQMCFNGALTSLRVLLYNTVPSSFDTTTTTGLTAGAWQLVFVAYNDGDGVRKGHIYKGVSGAVSEYAYSAQPAMTGTFKAPTTTLNLWNDVGQITTFDGLVDEALIFSGNLTPAQRTQLAVLAGV
jgi:hypothetical protein